MPKVAKLSKEEDVGGGEEIGGEDDEMEEGLSNEREELDPRRLGVDVEVVIGVSGE
jgi:hypothetical protein